MNNLLMSLNMNNRDDYVTFLYNYTDLSDDLCVDMLERYDERNNLPYNAILGGFGFDGGER